jgi:phage major head subunit gpT-like protein
VDTDRVDFPGQTPQSNRQDLVFDAAGTAFRAARQQMWGIRKPNGKLANVRPTHIIAPSALEGPIDQLFNQNVNANGSSNTLFGAVQAIIDPRLDAFSTTAWWLVDLSKSRKPFIVNDREGVSFTAQNRLEDDSVFEENVVRFGGKARFNVGYADWHLIFGSDGVP